MSINYAVTKKVDKSKGSEETVNESKESKKSSKAKKEETTVE